MAKMKGNIFGEAAKAREAEQANIESEIKDESPMVKRGRPTKTTEKTITMTIRITEERRQKLKEYAVTHMTTISEMIAQYVDNL